MQKADLGYTVRVATARDTAAVDALLTRSYPKLLKQDYPPSMLVMALPIISRARPELLQSGLYYVAETGQGEIIGAGGWSRRRQHAHVGEVRHVVTDDRALRQGVARAILRHALAVAGGQGIALMDCLSTRTAVPFYQAMGFATLGPVDVPLGEAILFPVIQMQRRL